MDEHEKRLEDIHDDVREIRKDIHSLRNELHLAVVNNAKISTQVRLQWLIIGAAMAALWAWVKTKLGI